MMKAAVFYGEKDISTEELPLPEIKDDEVLVQIKACGICGTDVHIYNGDEGAAKTPSGTVLGHEFSGVVVKAGAKADGVSVGDRVCVDPNKLCNSCYYCKSGIGHFCENMVGIGTTVNGGFAEYCAVPVSQVYKFPETASFEEAAMTEPVACCLHGIDMCDISAGDTVLIIGGGMIGLIMLQLARLRGAAKLIMVEPIEAKRGMAAKLGADLCIDPFNEDVLDVLERENIKRVNTVIECVGSPKTMSQAISYAGRKSTVMFFGLTAPDAEIGIKPFEIFKKEIVIKSSFINPYTQKRALDLICTGRIDVKSLIAKRAGIEELGEILENPALRSEGKVIIIP